MLHTGTKPYIRGEVARMAEAIHFSNLKQNKVNEFQIQYSWTTVLKWLDSVTSKTKRPLFQKLVPGAGKFRHVVSKKKGLFDLGSIRS